VEEVLKLRKLPIIFLSLIIIVGLTAVFSTQIAAENPAIASINTEELFQVHPAIENMQMELQEKQMEMMADLEDADEEEAMMMQEQMQMELQELQEELLDEAFAEIEADVGSIAADLGYDVVIDPQGVVAGADYLDLVDITEEVLEQL